MKAKQNLGIGNYIRVQKSNLQSIEKLPHFAILVPLVNQLYDSAIKLAPRTTPPRYARFLLLCHNSFLSAATLIGQAQPYDAAAITRRAIEIARVCLASKFNQENAEKWMAYEKRQARWEARQEGRKPPFLPPIRLDLPVNHPILKDLEREAGILSDGYVHFTPEYYASQNWRDKRDVEPPVVNLVYFISDQKVIERELILLSGTHAKILQIFDESLDNVFTKDQGWQGTMALLVQQGSKLGKPFEKMTKRDKRA